MNTQAPAPTPNTLTRAIALLEHLTPVWFAMVMGWCGLSQAWLRASDVLGETALGLGLVAALVALFIFMLLCLACVVRLQAHPQAVAADMRHPVRYAFMATLPISLMLLTSLGVHLFWGTDRNLDTALRFLWCVGALLEVMATFWVISRWLNGADSHGLQWATLSPVFFIPVVGNVLAPIAGVRMGLETWATAQFGVGLFLWLVLQTLMLVRVAQAGPLPARMAPAWFITIVPPSLIGLSFLQLEIPLPWVWMMWGIGAFFLGVSLTQARLIREQAFSMAKWGMSFPLGAFTSLTWRMTQLPGGAWLELPATLLLAITSLLILSLTLHTWHGLRQGYLLVPEK